MPYDITINEHERMAVIRLMGAISGRTIYRALFDLVGREDWMPGYATIWDGRKVTELVASPVDTDHLVQAAEDLGSLVGPGRTACVTGREVDTMFAHMLVCRLRHTQRERKVFTSMIKAIQWACEPNVSRESVRSAILRSTMLG